MGLLDEALSAVAEATRDEVLRSETQLRLARDSDCSDPELWSLVTDFAEALAGYEVPLRSHYVFDDDGTPVIMPWSVKLPGDGSQRPFGLDRFARPARVVRVRHLSHTLEAFDWVALEDEPTWQPAISAPAGVRSPLLGPKPQRLAATLAEWLVLNRQAARG